MGGRPGRPQGRPPAGAAARDLPTALDPADRALPPRRPLPPLPSPPHRHLPPAPSQPCLPHAFVDHQNDNPAGNGTVYALANYNTNSLYTLTIKGEGRREEANKSEGSVSGACGCAFQSSLQPHYPLPNPPPPSSLSQAPSTSKTALCPPPRLPSSTSPTPPRPRCRCSRATAWSSTRATRACCRQPTRVDTCTPP